MGAPLLGRREATAPFDLGEGESELVAGQGRELGAREFAAFPG